MSNNSEITEDFKEKRNYFANWFFSAIAGNLVFLVKLDYSVTCQSIWAICDYWLTVGSLVTFFLFKFFAVIAAWIRVNEANAQHDLKKEQNKDKPFETARVWIWAIFLALGIFALFCSAVILYYFKFTPMRSGFQ